MLDRSLEAEFEGYRKILPTNEARRSFDERIDAEAIRVMGIAFKCARSALFH